MDGNKEMQSTTSNRYEKQSRDLEEERQEIQRLIDEQSKSSQEFLAGKFTFN